MNRHRKTIITLGLLTAALATGAQGASRGLIGGAEVGVAEFNNARAVSGGTTNVSERARYAAATLSAFQGVSADRGALVAKFKVQQLGFERTESLNHVLASAGLGLYRMIGARQSILASAEARALRFEDSRRDDTIWTGRVSYTLKLSQAFRVNAEGWYDSGTEQTLSGLYDGYGVSASLAFSPGARFSIVAGINGEEKAFERRLPSESAQARSTGNAPLELQEISEGSWMSVSVFPSKRIYISGSVARRSSRSADGGSLSGETYTLGLGLKF